MPRTSRSKDGKPSEDIGWKFAEPYENSRSKMYCKFCNKLCSGGITRFKQHLAGIEGEIVACPRVPSNIRKDIKEVLKEREKKKFMKRENKRNVEDKIYQMIDDNDGEETEDDDFEVVRRESLEQFQRDSYRRSRGSNYDEGGSSGMQSRRVPMARAHSVRDTADTPRCRVRHVDNTIINRLESLTPAERLRAVELELEVEKDRKKQKKINTGWLKRQKEKLMNAFGKFIVHNRLPFTVTDSPYTRPLMKVICEVGPNVSPPTPYQLAEVWLPRDYRLMKEYIASFAGYWKDRGVSIMCDAWTGPTRMYIINFLIYSNRGTVFHKSVNATDVEKKDAWYYFTLMKRVIEEVGEEKVVQVVTDNEAAMKAAGKMIMRQFPHLYWTACSAHCLDLVLEDFGKRQVEKECIEKAKKITQFIYNYNWVTNYMKKFTNGRELLRPGITRFATNFIALESIYQQRTALRSMFESEGWVNSRYGKMKDRLAKEVRETILCDTSQGRRFWQQANDILKVQEPILKVLRLVDGDDKPTMGYLCEAITRAKVAIKENSRYYQSYWNIIDSRWQFQLHHDLHLAGMFCSNLRKDYV